MTEEQFDKASELMEQRNYYKELARKVEYSIWNKNRLDEQAKEEIQNDPCRSHGARFTLRKYFGVRLCHKKEEPIVAVRPHWEMANDINIDADPELISLILEWLKKKANEYDGQIREI